MKSATLYRALDIGICLTAFVLLWIGFATNEGAGGGSLVLKPVPSPQFWYSAGEEGGWERRHPLESRPWYLTGRYITLKVDSECVMADWPLRLWFGTIMFWKLFLMWALIRLCMSWAEDRLWPAERFSLLEGFFLIFYWLAVIAASFRGWQSLVPWR